MNVRIVLGLGFGDEGKGHVVSYLCSQNPDSLVVRFHGGHQAGHTVVFNGVRHVFSSLGSGTLQGIPTLWSKNCTFYPTALKNEFEILRKKIVGFMPDLYVDPLCPVTTPFDVYANLKDCQHGTVGVGFGKTIERHEKYFKLHFQDLFFDSILRAKLSNIRQYYGVPRGSNFHLDTKEQEFLDDVRQIREYYWLKSSKKLHISVFKNIIFEGAQGILLDMDFGFFPNVTRSNTTSKNAFELLKEFNLQSYPEMLFNIEIYYVTRSYQTRHGLGFMTNETDSLMLANNENETNRSDGKQGKFRIGTLDPNLLSYAIQCDDIFSNGYIKNLVITCLDQTKNALLMHPAELLDTKIFKNIITFHGEEDTGHVLR